MEIRGNEFLALATDGDVQLGGHDWDQRLVDFVAEEFMRKHGLDPREDPNTAGRLWRECEDAKRHALGPQQGHRSLATTRARPCASKSPARSSRS